MSLNERQGQRSVDQRRIQDKVLAAMAHRILKGLHKYREGQNRARQQQLELILRRVLRDQLIGNQLSLTGESTQTRRQGVGGGVGGRHGRE